MSSRRDLRGTVASSQPGLSILPCQLYKQRRTAPEALKPHTISHGSAILEAGWPSENVLNAQVHGLLSARECTDILPPVHATSLCRFLTSKQLTAHQVWAECASSMPIVLRQETRSGPQPWQPRHVRDYQMRKITSHT